MDQYGCYRNTPEDIAELKWRLEDEYSILFSYSGDQIGALIILITTGFRTLGTMPFGGNPLNRIYVSIYGRGASHFSIEDTHASYFCEKLNITQCEGEWMEQLWKGLHT